MTRYHTFLDDSTSGGLETIQGIQQNGGEFGVGISSNINVGIVTATEGFISVANTTPIQIILNGNELIFNAIGIGSTSFILS